MGVMFFSAEWVAAFKDAINENPDYKTAAAEWTQGVVALVSKALPRDCPRTPACGSISSAASAARRSS